MYSFSLLFIALILVSLVASDAPNNSKRPLVFHNWPPHNSKQIAGKQRTLVVQIRSDKPVPLLFKGRPNNGQTHAHNHVHPHAHAHTHAHALPHPLALHSVPMSHLRNIRPVKIAAPIYYKPVPAMNKPLLRKPLKIKLNNAKIKSKPIAAFEKPFQFEKPTTEYHYELQSFENSDKNKLPLITTFDTLNDRYAPIHTIPAPNLSLQDNHLHADENQDMPINSTKKPKPQNSQQQQQQKHQQQQQHQEPHEQIHGNQNQYQVFEEQTNDQTIIDPNSATQKLYAPDPDPSLPTSKLKLATEHFNQPSNGKPLPADVQSNHLPNAQALVQIVGPAQQDIYPLQFTQQTAAALQPFISANLAAIQPAAPIPLYNPTYLVTQSNNLYTQHKQQLFNTPIIQTGYYNADLTQEVAPDGSIVQPSKEAVIDSTPQFAALLAASAAADQSLYQPAALRLPNTAVSTSAAPQSGFVVSNYYENPQDSSQLLQAYADEEAQRQRLEAEQASIEIQKHKQLLQQEEAEQALLLQQKQNHLYELQQQRQQLLLQQQQQQHHEQQQQQQLRLQQQQHEAQQHNNNPAANAFEEHARLVQQQLGTDTPLRIFVPDEEPPVIDLPRLHKRSEELKKGTVEDVNMNSERKNPNDNNNMRVEVSSSVEVSNENQMNSSSEMKNYELDDNSSAQK